MNNPMSNVAFIEKVKSFISVGKDFRMPIGMTVAAISLSAISMGLSLAFIPAITQLAAESIEKRKGNNIKDVDEKEMIRNMAVKIERGIQENEDLRNEVMSLIKDAYSSSEFRELILDQMQISDDIYNEIKLLADKFPELQADIKIIDENVSKLLKTTDRIERGIEQIKEDISNEVKRAYRPAWEFGYKLGTQKFNIVYCHNSDELESSILEDLRKLSRLLDLNLDGEFERLSSSWLETEITEKISIINTIYENASMQLVSCQSSSVG